MIQLQQPKPINDIVCSCSSPIVLVLDSNESWINDVDSLNCYWIPAGKIFYPYPTRHLTGTHPTVPAGKFLCPYPCPPGTKTVGIHTHGSDCHPQRSTSACRSKAFSLGFVLARNKPMQACKLTNQLSLAMIYHLGSHMWIGVFLQLGQHLYVFWTSNLVTLAKSLGGYLQPPSPKRAIGGKYTEKCLTPVDPVLPFHHHRLIR